MTEDRQAINQVLAGDTEAYRSLVERYQRPVFCMIANLLPNRHDAEDIAQDVFLAAYRSLGRYDADRCAFSTWLFTIARNKCLSALRKKRPELLADPPQAADALTPCQRVQGRELLERLDEALGGLPAEQRTAFVLVEMMGLSPGEMAQIEGVEPGTARARLSRAKAALRESLRGFGESQ